MATPIPLDMEPMLALLEPDLPNGEGWEYEPKWDGFRTIVHRDGDRVELISRGARPMTRYFPELLAAFRSLPAERLVLDGEIVLVTQEGLDFDALQQRIHPADSRVRLLSERTPAGFIAFDVLAVGDHDLRTSPLAERRSRLEAELSDGVAPIHLTPYTRELETARDWFDRFEGAGLDGVIAKRLSQPYLPGKRGWVKVKHERTADCVVIGFRWSADRKTLGALLLGLYDAEGRLHYVGHTSSFSAAEKRELLERLEPLREVKTAEHMGRAPGGPSRWSRGKETDWEPVRPELVCEVSYDKLQSGERFRHATGFRRWRPDKPPRECGFDQIVSAARFDVGAIFAGR
jgi:DNA ligase D-like protein (predicted ligase)